MEHGEGMVTGLGAILLFAVFILPFAVGIVSLLDVFSRRDLTGLQSFAWIAGMLMLFPLLGILYYFGMRRRQRRRSVRKASEGKLPHRAA